MFRVDMYLQKIYTQVNYRYDSGSKVGYSQDQGPVATQKKISIGGQKYFDTIEKAFSGSENELEEGYEYIIFQNVMPHAEVIAIDKHIKSKGYKLAKTHLNKYFKYPDKESDPSRILSYFYVYNKST